MIQRATLGRDGVAVLELVINDKVKPGMITQSDWGGFDIIGFSKKRHLRQWHIHQSDFEHMWILLVDSGQLDVIETVGSL